MNALEQSFQERLSEIETYLDLLAAFEDEVRGGPPKVGGGGAVISATQQRILYSSVYLQLYNLIEATVTNCFDAVSDAVTDRGRWRPGDLSIQLRGEWVRYLAKTHADLNYENRLKQALEMCEHLISTHPVRQLKIEKGGGGNWNDEEIYRFSERLGCPLSISAESNKAIKRPFRNDRGAIELIVKLRNDLAHGSVSFGECGSGVTVAELRELKAATAMYLNEVVVSFKNYIVSYGFLNPESRPAEVRL